MIAVFQHSQEKHHRYKPLIVDGAPFTSGSFDKAIGLVSLLFPLLFYVVVVLAKCSLKKKFFNRKYIGVM